MSWLWVFIGGGLGSLCRYGIAKLMIREGVIFPWATLLANVLSCVVLGLAMGVVMKSESSSSIRLFWMIGFCGGFSTFSTFTAEVFNLLQAGHYFLALSNIVGSVLVCMMALFLGLKLVGV